VERRDAAAARSRARSAVVLATALVASVLAAAGATSLAAADPPDQPVAGPARTTRVVPATAPWSLPDPDRRPRSLPETRGAGAAPQIDPATGAASVSAVATSDQAPPEPSDPPDGAPSRRGALGIPIRVMQAYQEAARLLAIQDPGCRLRWEVVAAIGRLESGHARGGRVRANGETFEPILGPLLDGSPFRAIRDSDDGRLDGNRTWDRAVGPMQFLPGTWAGAGRDGDGDGRRDPHDIDDAAAAAAGYLCAGSGDLSGRAQLSRAVLRYNRSQAYVSAVLAWADAYAAGRAVPVAGPPEPEPEPAPAPTPKPKPTSKPTPTRQPTVSPSPSASPTTSPTPSPTPAASASPSPTPSPSPTATATPTPSPAPSPSASAASSGSATPTARSAADPTPGGATGGTPGPSPPG
jgi:membrane-bound lytic murein transglycosylase B